jgi:hypothetical protein
VVAVTVVDCLESVEVGEEDGSGVVGATSPGDGLIQQLLEQGPVGQSRQASWRLRWLSWATVAEVSMRA